MKALFRPLLLWFLLAAVPLQGFAAAAMLLCGPTAVQASTPLFPTSQAQHMDGGHDHAAMLAAQHDGHSSPQAVHPDSDGSHGDHVKCTGAGACCIGAPLAPSPPKAPPSQDGRCATVPLVLTAPAAVDLAGPERPPKHPIA